MKTLFVSLMRLGDLLMMEPLLRSYQKKYKAEIHLLIYREFAFAESLFPFVKHWYYIDRVKMQDVGRRRDQHILNNYYYLEDLRQQIHQHDYSAVISLSHNHVSHHFLSALELPGTQFIGSRQENDSIHYGSPWIQYLNDIGSFQGVSAYHLIDIYRAALGLDRIEAEPDVDLFYGNSMEIPSEPYVCMQLTSFEEKKSFSLAKWSEVIKYYRQLEPFKKILILGAPSEGEVLQGFVENQRDTHLQLAICDLKTAKALIHRAQVLVTPDTAIKYLAMGSNTKVFELSLGSSQQHQTGAYLADALIVAANLPCAPCGHRETCPFESFRCQDIMGADTIGYSLFHYSQSNWLAMDILANEFHGEIHFYRSQFLANDFWFASQLGVEALTTNLQNILYQSSWQLILQEDKQPELACFHSQAENIRRYLIENNYTDPQLLRPALERAEAILLGMELESKELRRSISTESLASKPLPDPQEYLSQVDHWFERNRDYNRCLPAFRHLYREAMEDWGSQNYSLADHILGNLNHLFRIERKLTEMIRIDYMEIL